MLVMCACHGACAQSPGRMLAPDPDGGDATQAAARVVLPEPSLPTQEESEEALFLGLDGVRTPLRRLLARDVSRARTPVTQKLPAIETAVLRRYGRRGFGGVVRHALALGVVGYVPISPAAMADLLTDPEVERQVVGARSFRLSTVEFRLQGAWRQAVRVNMGRRGIGPLRFDLRFTMMTERRDLPDGCVLLRYDPRIAADTEHVTLYRGGCLLVPADGGAKVAEILILGSDLPKLPFLTQKARRAVYDTLEDRATNLWKRAWGSE